MALPKSAHFLELGLLCQKPARRIRTPAPRPPFLQLCNYATVGEAARLSRYISGPVITLS
jgi:hypothetical protein